jgi:hypothetical protein
MRHEGECAPAVAKHRAIGVGSRQVVAMNMKENRLGGHLEPERARHNHN